MDQRRNLRRLDLEPLHPAERQQLSRQPRPAFGRRQRVLGIALELRVLDPLRDQVQAPDNDGEQIVEVVRDAAGELPQRLHLLALPELLLRRHQLVRRLADLPLEIELRLLGRGDVARHPDEARHFPVRPEARLRHAPQPAILAVRPRVPPLEREGLARRLPGDAFGDDAVAVVRMDPLAPVERPRFVAAEAGERDISLIDEIA